MSFSTKILLGLIAGIAVGLFFGESVHHLEIFANGFVNLLRMTVLPYITVSLIFNLGRMDARQARLLALRGGAILAALWALSILVSFLFPFAFPYVERASFFSTTLVEAREQFNFIELYIPANPFHSLANNIVPAVVLFSVLLGIAIMQLEEKTPLLKVLNVADQAISQVTRFVFRLTPYGLFAVAAVASGTLRMTEIERIEVYLLTYVALALVMALWILPGLVSAITPIGYRDVLGPTRDALITAFLVGELFIVLPMLTEASKEILARNKITQKEDSELPDIIFRRPLTFLTPLSCYR
jgi:Na+/H+-dicarboxylate symporter